MTDIDGLPDLLRARMRQATDANRVSPDLLERVHRGVSRRRRRDGALAALLVGTGVAVLGVPLAGGFAGSDRLTVAASGPAARSEGGRLAVEVTSVMTSSRSELVALPAYLINNGNEPLTVVALSVPGTDLRAEFSREVTLTPGGKLPLTIERFADCAPQPALPAQLQLRVTADGEGGRSSVRVPLPRRTVGLYRTSDACG